MPFFVNCREVAIASVLYKKVFWKNSQNSQESTCTRTSVLAKLQADVIKKEILAQVFPYEFCDIFKNTFFQEHLQDQLQENSQKNVHGEMQF